MSRFEDTEHFRAWKRYEDAAHGEKDWMHQRLTWLLTSQSILLAAYGIIINSILRYESALGADQAGSSGDDVQAVAPSLDASVSLDHLKALPHVIALAGFAVAVLGLVATTNAMRMHWRWTGALNAIVEALEAPGALTFGIRPHWPARLTSLVPPFMSAVFLAAWAYVLNVEASNPFLSSLIWFFVPVAVIAVGVVTWELLRDAKCREYQKWTPKTTYGWKSDPETGRFEQFDATTVVLGPEDILVCDFDGVMIDGLDEAVYRLPPTTNEIQLLGQAAERFGIDCAGMTHNYQRHLLYQAAAHILGKKLAPGPALAFIKEASQTVPAFVLSARSGWHAVERQRIFLVEQGLEPVETFQVGRVRKDLQIVHLLEEFPERTVVYIEDDSRHLTNIEEVVPRKAASRLRLLHVAASSVVGDVEAVRIVCEGAIKSALSTTGEK